MKRYSFSLFFIFLCMSTPLRALVAPILPNEGVWNVVTRLGTTIDAISTGGLGCDVVIQQADIGDGDIFTISSDYQTYCLSENLTFTFGDAIEITGSYIILDLNNKSINGGGNGVNAIKLSGGASNIVIKNGTLKNVTGYGIGDVTDSATNESILIESIQFIDNATKAISFSETTVAAVDGLVVQDCRFSDCGSGGSAAIECTVGLSSVVVRRCIFDESREGNYSGIHLSDFIQAKNRHALVEDCVLTSTLDGISSGFGVTFTNLRSVEMQRCFLSGYGGIGIEVDTAAENCVFRDCVAENFLSYGYLINGSVANVLFERCVAINSGGSQVGAFGIRVDGASALESATLVDCVSVASAGHGFYFQTTADPAEFLNNLVMRDCCAQNSVGNGFAFFVGNQMENALLERCIAQDNGGDGFYFDASMSGDVIEHIVLRDCIAQNNQGGYLSVLTTATTEGSGFVFQPDGAGVVNDVILQGCIAENNTNHGFDLNSTTSLIKVIDCCAKCNGGVGFNNDASDANMLVGNSAIRNVGGDYVGITDLTKIVSFNFPGAFMGAGKWVNAST